MKRIEVVYSGRVQGVGFRYTAERLAVNSGIVGYVKNLPDSGVEIAAEGEEEKLKRFLAAIETEMNRYIKKTFVNWRIPTGEYKSFKIAY